MTRLRLWNSNIKTNKPYRLEWNGELLQGVDANGLNCLRWERAPEGSIALISARSEWPLVREAWEKSLQPLIDELNAAPRCR